MTTDFEKQVGELSQFLWDHKLERLPEVRTNDHRPSLE